jgi:alpha-galactosidase
MLHAWSECVGGVWKSLTLSRENSELKKASCSFALAVAFVGLGCSQSAGPSDGGSNADGGKGGSPLNSGGSNPTAGASSTTGGAGASTTGGASAASGAAGAPGAAGAGTGGTGGGGGGGHVGGAAGSGGAAGGGGASGSAGAAGAAGAAGGGSTIVGATPPMGWNSWNNFGCSPSESLLKGVADVFVSSGMAAAGYKYVNIDDCWMSGRDSSGNLVADATKFPSGIKALADYVHGKGLKLGIYETPYTTTCAGKTGGQGHETQDAKSYAAWGIDYLKYDDCRGALTGFATMHDALIAAGRPIFYSINPVYGAGSCVPPNCAVDELKLTNMWRIGFDITNTWASFTGLIDTDKPLAQYAGPGHWNDPDMLEVGRGMSADEDRSHFGMWAMLAAPLIAGNDITKMSDTTKAILTNTDVIAVNQDPLGKQATVVATSGSNQVWAKKLSGTNTYAVALFNRSGSAASMTVKWSDVGLPAGSATVRDLYAQKDLGPSSDSYTATSVPSHGIVMLKIVSAP